MGISGLETALALCLRAIPLEAAVERLTFSPAATLGLTRHVPGIGSLSKGAPGDVVIIDPEVEWTVEPETFASLGKNTPLAGRTLKGRVVATVFGGKAVWQA